ncbi:hypothetical protein I545_2490 [Mycobacterium kansasii 662]|uniref:Uncharacterized protein n=2 Tax=Mycobacterium kansasii TaxID=1768 RepID=A0A1V3XH03_MYCKA|nr:hypothetical protein I547_4401 [Mycobacterium kansasii 824]EUA19667.1 hypothetical protein I545_2490 [Mycobacterium kansasii 662]OOK78432.1 hypothetical protein BZL30_1595 [Mycobacterium kansasii]
MPGLADADGGAEKFEEDFAVLSISVWQRGPNFRTGSLRSCRRFRWCG